MLNDASGAEAPLFIFFDAARLKPCPDTKVDFYI
jgi:hypothetical protein